MVAATVDHAAAAARIGQQLRPTTVVISGAPTVDHARGASSIGATLRPTTTTFAGNPPAGTPLMQANQTMGIDLPIRYLAWQDEAGVVRVGHPDIRVLAQRHGVTGVGPVLKMITRATDMFTAAAAGARG